MLELLISLMMSMGIQFTMLDNGKVEISSKDRMAIEASDVYKQSEFIGSLDDIVITDGVDPSASTAAKE